MGGRRIPRFRRYLRIELVNETFLERCHIAETVGLHGQGARGKHIYVRHPVTCRRSMLSGNNSTFPNMLLHCDRILTKCVFRVPGPSSPAVSAMWQRCNEKARVNSGKQFPTINERKAAAAGGVLVSYSWSRAVHQNTRSQWPGYITRRIHLPHPTCIYKYIC